MVSTPCASWPVRWRASKGRPSFPVEMRHGTSIVSGPTMRLCPLKASAAPATWCHDSCSVQPIPHNRSSQQNDYGTIVLKDSIIVPCREETTLRLSTSFRRRSGLSPPSRPSARASPGMPLRRHVTPGIWLVSYMAHTAWRGCPRRISTNSS